MHRRIPGRRLPDPRPLLLGLLVAAYLAATPGRRWLTAILGAATIALYGLLALLAPPSDRLGDLGFPWLVVVVLAIGQVVSELAADTERRRREAQESEAERRVIEERLRIARELHDVVSHSMAMINVQSGVAAHVIKERPEQAVEALLAIKAASHDALVDLRGILGLLRQDDEAEPREPVGGAAQLSGLVENARRAGLDVELAVDGDLGCLPRSLDITVFRVVQEALTNAVRHAPGSAVRVSVAAHPVKIEVHVADDGPRAPATEGRPGTGHGLAGMRERIRALVGTLEAGPRSEGGFAVIASIPR